MLVLLVVLNLGVAAWWMTRAPQTPVAPVELPAGVERLQLLDETGAAAMAATAGAQRCVQFGPFPDDALLQRARRVLGSLARGADLKLVQTRAPPPQTWRVVMPPLPDGDQARAVAQRIDAAGFEDFLTIGDGAEADSIALGTYSSLAAARERQADLIAAGFQAQVHPVGGTSSFVAIALAGSADVAGLRREIGALQANPVDCATLR